MIRFGISGLPPDDGDDAAFLEGLVAAGHQAFELAFVTGFPWKEARCRRFGELAAERDLRLSVHAPYFAILTVEDEDRAKQCLAALEHTMKLGKALGAPLICAHLGHRGERSADQLMELVRRRLQKVSGKVAPLGVGLGLETAGTQAAFGTLGDIAVLAEEFSFVRPVVDWAHLHAMTGGALTTPEAFAAVIRFIRESFPGWMLDPLHTQFTDTLVGRSGEVRHLPYGEGTLRVGPLVTAARQAGLRMVLISEAREPESHQAIWEEIQATLGEETTPAGVEGRPLGSGRVDFPDEVRAVAEGGSWRPLEVERPLLLSNLDKRFFPDGYTKGDLIQYYAAVAPALLPHLRDRPISMSRYPDGIEGSSFYEKRAPGHQPEWMRTAAVPSDSAGGSVEFLLACDQESLMWFANMGCIEMHPFHSRAQSLEHPDYAIFDLDPAEGSRWEQVVAGARLLQVALERLELAGYPKLSGARGLHVYVPLEAVHSFARVRRFVEAVGRLLVAANPADLTMEWEIPRRKGKVFIDHNRNASGQTIASVYSVRPLPGAPVSTPIRWEEVGSIRNQDVTIAGIWERLNRWGDLFAPVAAGGQTLDAAEAALGLA